MRPSTLDALLHSGRLGEALELVRSDSGIRTPSLLVLEAELVSRLTSSPDALVLVLDVANRVGLDADLRARALSVAGEMHLKLGRQQSGLDLLHRANMWADRTENFALRAQVQVARFSALATWLGPEIAAGEMAATRRAVTIAGDSSLTVQFHLALGEIEAKRAVFSRAVKHFTIARNLLGREPSLYLAAQLELREGAVDLLKADYQSSIKKMRQALELIGLCRAPSLEVVARVNLAHAYLATGQYGACEEELERAQMHCRKGGSAEVGILDEQLQLAMAQESHTEAERLVAEATSLSASIFNGASYYGLWLAPTRAKWMAQNGHAGQGVSLLYDALPEIERVADRNLIEKTIVQYAVLLAHVGDTNRALRQLLAIVRTSTEPSLEHFADTQRVAGTIVAAGDLRAARQYLCRAIRCQSAAGNLTARSEVVCDGARIGISLGVDPPPPEGEEWPHFRGIDPWDDCDPASTSRTIECAGALTDLAGYPPLAGCEALTLLHASQAAVSAAVSEENTRGSRDAVAWFGCDAVDANALANSTDAIHLPLGSWRDRSYDLAIRSHADAARRLTVHAVERFLRTALERHAARERERERAALWPEQTPEQQLGMIFASEIMTDLVRTARRIAPSNVTVLITGETGTGKELLARAIHEASPRKEKGLLPFNCATVPKEMLDSQLFGHRRGAFTGAHDASPGVIRAAAGGTLFLDEIAEMGPDVQPKLLRFLESSEIHPLGEPRPLVVDVRIIAATNAPLDLLVQEGRFREDLFYRLNVVRLHIPPLRERREEIPLLINYHLERAAQEAGKTALRVAEETMEYLVLYRWPGNIRQLANEARRLAALAEPGAILMPEHLAPDIAASRRTRPPSERDLAPTELVVRLDQPMNAATEHLERAQIQHVLTITNGRMEDAARMLGLSRKGLYLKRQRLGIA